ncbi:MAG: glycosyl transferase [Bacteroidaceae bacterium]|nr:glycosyl transferase [Bacteroidaceae bacterium]
MNKFVKGLKKPYLILPHFWMACSRFINSDEMYLKVLYRLCHGKKLNLGHPVTYTEKLQWLKLHNTSELCTQLVDKYGVREYIKEKIGEKYLIPLLGVWEHFDDIDFDKLPDRFVLKTNHGSGGVIICKDKSVLNKESAKRTLEKSLKKNYFWVGREYPYRNVPPRIIAEKFMEDDEGNPPVDYKFFCFDGEPQVLFYASERFNSQGLPPKFDYYDIALNHLPVRSKGHENAVQKLQMFPQFEEMKQLARILSEGFPHVRVDLYLVDGKIYFGEMTFHHDGGLVPFIPEDWDKKFGDMIKLPNV